MKNAVMTIDVEDWFQVENLKKVISITNWDNLELRVEKNVDKVLNILESNNTKATFFVLGWIAEKRPELIKKIYNNGHEIASHGYEHELCDLMEEDKLIKDIKKSKDILENLTGNKIFGYRAPSFSISDRLIDILIDLGFSYDSSFFPIKFHDRYGTLTKYNIANKPFYKIKDSFIEIPLSYLRIFNLKIPLSGGGYFRLFPYYMFRQGVKKIIRKQNFYCFYIHPWEFDNSQPRLKSLDFKSRFRHYNNLNTTESKFNRLIKDIQFTSIKDFLRIN
jgi:polysaccharide deacetylase family protein (PEP-CTERM system associated)